MRLTPFLLTLTLSVGLTGCFGSKKKPLIPVPATPKQQVPSFPAPVPPPPPPETPPPAATELPAGPEHPVVKPPLKPQPRRPVPATPAVKPPVTPEPAPESPPLKLGAILSPEQRVQYQAELKQSLAAARLSIGRTRGQTLNDAQRETAARIQTFIQQAETMTGSDLATAVQLARRAELLGDDLVKSLR